MELLDQKAKENKEKYDQNVMLSVQSLYDFWRSREHHHTDRRTDFAKRSSQWGRMKAAAGPDLATAWTSNPAVNDFIESRCRDIAQELMRQIIERANVELQQRKDLLESEFCKLVETGAEPTYLPISEDFSNSLLPGLVDRVERCIPNVIRRARIEILHKISQVTHDHRSTFGSVFEHAKAADLLDKDDDYYKEFGSTIRLKLREFMPIVGMFKGAVTSTDARNLIARTGLGQKLDILDDVGIEDGSADDHAERFLQNVFPTRLAKRNALTTSAKALLERRDLVESALSSVTRSAQGEMPQSDFADQFLFDTPQFDAEKISLLIVENAIAAMEYELGLATNRWRLILGDAQRKFSSKIKEDRAKYLRRFYARVGGIVGICVFVGVLVIAGLVATGLQAKIGWGWSLFSSVASSFTPAVIKWGSRRIAEVPGTFLPPRSKRIAQEISSESLTLLAAPVFIQTEGLGPLVERTARESLKTALMRCLVEDRNATQGKYMSLWQAEHDATQLGCPQIDAYVAAWNSLALAMVDWYQPDEYKKRLISEAASEIKARAIEPALQLFAARLLEIRNFSANLQEISI